MIKKKIETINFREFVAGAYESEPAAETFNTHSIRNLSAIITPLPILGAQLPAMPSVSSVGFTGLVGVAALGTVAIGSLFLQQFLAKKGLTNFAEYIESAFKFSLPILFVGSIIYFLIIRNPFL